MGTNCDQKESWRWWNVYPSWPISIRSTCVLTNDISVCKLYISREHTEQYNVLFTDMMGNPQEGYGRGGGVHVSIKNSIDHVHMSFLGCHFIGNHAFIGGGLSVKCMENRKMVLKR